MTEPILVVDLGTSSTAAAIVAQRRIGLLRDPLTGGYRWPSSVCLSATGLLAGTAAERRRRAEPRQYAEGPRSALDTQSPLRLGDRELTGVEVITGYLGALSAEAHAVYGAAIPRLVVTVPAGYPVPDPRRDALLGIGAAAGFTETELLTDAAAISLDPGTATAPGSLVLICDLGAGWTVALVRSDDDRPELLAQRSLPGGRELDAVLVADLRENGRSWLEPLLAAAGDAGLRAHQETVDFVRRLQHRLSTAEEATDHLTPMSPAYSLDRTRFAELAGPAVAALVAACHEVLAEAQVNPDELTSVILAGAGARLPVVAEAIAGAVGHEPRRTPDPELATIRGAARWAARADERRIPADPPRWRVEPVLFEVPAGSRMLRRRPGATGLLAEIRTPDDLVHGLAAPLLPAGPLPPAGSVAGPVVAIAARRPAAALAADPPPVVRRFGPAAAWLFDPGAQLLIGYADGVVRTYHATDGTPRGESRPDTTDPGRIHVGPAGPVLLTWGADDVSGWDVDTGRRTIRLAGTAGALDVLVDEQGWRVAVEIPAKASVGRYRRSSVGVWDLRTGARLEQADGTGFAADSVRDGLGTTRVTPDGLLTVGVGAGQVTLAENGTVLFHTAGERAAFTADGRHLLIQAGGMIDVRAV